ncbi:MAG: HypC/HybG/HupF family hydrogenase formation chaperone [bacterium]|nr:HypC/HybG/HupF family hydrogenase formation chaperone [bacterium]
MCLATPCKVAKIEKDWAVVKNQNHSHRVNTCLLKNVKIGDYLLVHGEMALNKLPKSEAEKILKLIKT